MDRPTNPPAYRKDTVLPLPPEVRAQAWVVDAACSGNPGPTEYQGVDLATGEQLFHHGPFQGTNNIGEFLAIVHALARMNELQISDKVVYSDSMNAITWVRKGKCNTKLPKNAATQKAYELIARAERWLRTHREHAPVLKWDTARWGECPADFGRKH